MSSHSITIEVGNLIEPEVRLLAKRMNATTVELDAGHMSLVSHPKEIADLIIKAAGQHKS